MEINYKKDELQKLKYNSDGLIPAILQDNDTGEVLMMAYMNQRSLEKTLKTGKACFWSRSRQELWLKGATSGNYQIVREIRTDCDRDTLLLKVIPEGPACHTGEKNCFFRQLAERDIDQVVEKKEFVNSVVFLKTLYQLIQERKEELPEDSYTTYLFNEGIDKIAKKLAEETAEVIIAAKNNDHPEIIYESADLIYHLLVLLVLYDITVPDIIEELAGRHKQD